MLRRTVSILISAALLATAMLGGPARAQTIKDLQATERARVNVLKMGVGQTSRVDVKLRDNTKLKGYISEASQNSFTVADPKTGSSQTISYADVAEVKKQGAGVSTRTWIIIGAAAAAAVIVGFAVKPAFCDGGAQTGFPC